MDNASKALIMAGAILISIAIVGVGVFIFSSTSSVQNSVTQQMDATAAQTTNSTFRRYTGDNVRGSTLNELIEYVKVINTNQALPVNMKIKVDSENAEEVTSSTSADYTTNAYYKVKVTDENADGYYDLITVGEDTGKKEEKGE